MANTITAGTVWDPYFYAEEAISLLYTELGLARAIHRGFDPTPSQKGSTIKISKPQAFTAASMPITTETALAPTEVEVVVDTWEGVEFALTDKELSFTKEKIINDHIRPAAHAIAYSIDVDIADKIKRIPWYYEAAGTPEVGDFSGIARILNQNKVLRTDRSLAINYEREDEYTQLTTFHEADKSPEGGMVQREGVLGRKWTFDVFTNGNIPDLTAGALTAGTQLQLNANVAAGASTAVFKDSGGSLSGTVKDGETFVIAGNTQRYAINADATAASNLITVTFEPAAAAAYSASDNVTLRQASKALNLACHREAIALAMCPLSDLGRRIAGANMAVMNDPFTGLSLRVTMWYDEINAKVYVRLDALWGIKILDYNKAARLES